MACRGSPKVAFVLRRGNIVARSPVTNATENACTRSAHLLVGLSSSNAETPLIAHLLRVKVQLLRTLHAINTTISQKRAGVPKILKLLNRKVVYAITARLCSSMQAFANLIVLFDEVTCLVW